MKRIRTILVFWTFSALALGQAKVDINSYTNFDKYRDANAALQSQAADPDRVVFMGNSITESWIVKSPEFFETNGYIDRGISGQVTAQMLLRFRADVIGLKPAVVVILAGINDIAQNSGAETIQEMADNIFSMVDMATAHDIRVILCSVLPAIDFPWHHGLEPAPKVIELNKLIKAYAEMNHIPYVDYYSDMADDQGGLKVPEYTSERNLVHPNRDGYKVMENLVKPVIDRMLSDTLR